MSSEKVKFGLRDLARQHPHKTINILAYFVDEAGLLLTPAQYENCVWRVAARIGAEVVEEMKEASNG